MHFRADTYSHQLLTNQQLTRISGHVLGVYFGSLTILLKYVFQGFCLRLLPITMLTKIRLGNNNIMQNVVQFLLAVFGESSFL